MQQDLDNVERLIQAGRYEQARQPCREYYKKYPSDQKCGYLLSLVYLNTGQFRECLQLVKKLMKQRPNALELVFNQASAFMGLGDYKAAADQFTYLLGKGARYPEVYYNLGVVCFKAGYFDRAVNALKKATTARPASHEALLYLAASYQQQGDYEKAKEKWLDLLKLKPDSKDAHYNLGLVFQHQGQFAGAIACYEKLLDIDPEHGNGWLNIANAYISADEDIKAQEALEKARLYCADKAAVSAAQLKLYQKHGAYVEAHALIADALEKGLESPRIATAYAAICSRFSEEDRAIELLRRILNKTHVDRFDVADMNYALARLYDQKGSYKLAFERAKLANESLPYVYDPADIETRLSKITGLPVECVNRRQLSDSSRDNVPVFIVGLPRSGTTLVEQIISSHPDMYGAGEMPYIANLAHEYGRTYGGNDFYTDWLCAIPDETIKGMADTYINTLLNHAKYARRIVDKMLSNFIYLGFIKALLPNARIIHCKRQPMDTCLSIYMQRFTETYAWAIRQEWLAHYYNNYQKIMDHWKHVVRIPMLEVEYESVVNNTDAEVERIIGFCGVEMNEACLRFYDSGRAVNTPSVEQVRQPVYASSVGKWVGYSENLGVLFELLESNKSIHQK